MTESTNEVKLDGRRTYVFGLRDIGFVWFMAVVFGASAQKIMLAGRLVEEPSLRFTAIVSMFCLVASLAGIYRARKS